MKYKVNVHELLWYNTIYTVEADNEEEAKDLIESGDANIYHTTYDTTEQMDFESFEVLEY